MPIADPRLIADLERRRTDLKACAESLLIERKAQGVTELTGPDEIRFRAMLADVERVEFQLSELRRMGAPPNLARAVEQAETRAQTTRSTQMSNYTSTVYRPGGQSYLRDLARIAVNADDTNESRRRLSEHSDEVGRGMESRDLSRVDGSGGYAVPPAWLMDQYIGLPRAGRAFGQPGPAPTPAGWHRLDQYSPRC